MMPEGDPGVYWTLGLHDCPLVPHGPQLQHPRGKRGPRASWGVSRSNGQGGPHPLPTGAASHVDSVPSAARQLLGGVWSIASTWSRLKLPTFWLGGNSLNVARNRPTYSCAGTSRKRRSILQCL